MRYASTVPIPIEVEGKDPLRIELPTHVYIELRRRARRAGTSFGEYFVARLLNQARAELEGRDS